MKIMRRVMALFLAITYAAIVQCPPMIEFKPEEVREVFRPETKPERFTEELNRDPIGFLKALDGHIDANIKTLPPEQLNRVTDMMLDSVRMMQNPALKAESLKNGLDIISKINIMDPTLKAQRIVKGLGIVAETGVDVSVKSPIIAKGLETLAKNNLLTQPVLAENPSFVTTLKNVLQTFKNRAATVMQSTGSVAEQSKIEMRTSAENIMSMFNATESATSLHDIIFDTAVDLMGISDKQGSLINNKNRAQLISDTSRLITAQAIQGKTEQQVLNQITRIENIILKFADATSMLTDPERKALSTLQNAIGQYNFPLPSHAVAIASLKAKINLIEAFNSGKAQESIPNLSADTFAQAFSVLTPLDNGRTFVDVFFDKLLATDRSTFKFDQMKPEQREALFKAVTDIKTLQKLGKNSIELFRPNGPIEQTLKSIWNEKNPQSKGNNAIEALDRLTLLMNSTKDQQIKIQLRVYATAMIDALKSVKIADIQAVHLPTLVSSVDRMINLYKDNKDFVSNLIDFATAKANSLVAEKNLKAAQELIKSGKATEQQKTDIASKEAQNEGNVSIVANMLSSLMKNTALTADQVSSLTYATQTLLNRISEPNILTKVVEIFGNNLATFPEKIRSTIFAQMLDRTSRITIDQKTFDTVIAPAMIKTIISDPTTIDTIPTDTLSKLLLNHQELAQPLFDALKKTVNKWSPTTAELERSAKIYSLLKNELLLDKVDKDNAIFKELAKTPAIFDVFAATRPEILARVIEPAIMTTIAENLNAGFDNAIKDPSKQNQALNTIGKITELTMTHLQSEDPKKRPELMSETIALLSVALDYLARSGQGLTLMNQPEGYWNDPQKNFLSQVTLSGQLLKTVRELQKMALDPKLLNEFNKQLVAYAQAINMKEAGTNINTWSIKQNITRAISNLLELPSIALTDNAKTVLLQSALNFVRGASALRGKDGKLDLKEFYKNPFKTGPEFSRYEYLGDTENILLLLMTKNAKFNATDFKTLQTFKNQDIAAFRKAIQANDFHSEIDPSSSAAQQELAKKNTEETKAIILKELDALSARMDMIEAFNKGDYAKVANLTTSALQEFPVFGNEGQTRSFAHHFIENILPKMLPTMAQGQAFTIASALLRPEMQVQLPREDYVRLLTSSPVSQLIDKISTVTTKPLLENLSKAINNPTIFDQKKLFDAKQIDVLKDFINKKLPKEYASTSKSTEL